LYGWDEGCQEVYQAREPVGAPWNHESVENLEFLGLFPVKRAKIVPKASDPYIVQPNNTTGEQIKLSEGGLSRTRYIRAMTELQ